VFVFGCEILFIEESIFSSIESQGHYFVAAVAFLEDIFVL